VILVLTDNANSDPSSLTPSSFYNMKFPHCLNYQFLLLCGFSFEATSWTSSPIYQARRSAGPCQFIVDNHRARGSSTSLSGMDFDDSLIASAPVVVAFALLIGVSAQTFINAMLQGDQGLGAFLKDGRGYKGSGFRPGDRQTENDPLPWLSLPKLDFVEVAGQESVTKQLERLRKDMTTKLEQGQVDEAIVVRNELEALMRANGFEFTANES